jgi:hypothetical protein
MNMLHVVIAGVGGFTVGRITQWIADARNAMGGTTRRNARTR